MFMTSNITVPESADVLQPQPPEPPPVCPPSAAITGETVEAVPVDVETEYVVLLPPKSRCAVQLRVHNVSKAAPQAVFDSPDV